MKPEERAVLIGGAASLGVVLCDQDIQQVDKYLALLGEWNERINLTGISGGIDRVIKLIVDSFSPSSLVKAALEQSSKFAEGSVNEGRYHRFTVLDIGSGAGLPGLMLALVVKGPHYVLAESRGKKASFIETAAAVLEIRGVEVYGGRAEQWGGLADVVTARAVGDLGMLARTARDVTRPGGTLVAMKGPGPQEEIERTRKKWERCGFYLEGVDYYNLPEDSGKRSLVSLIKK